MTGTPLRLAFAGTPEPAAIVLEQLLDTPAAGQVTMVCTRPDRPAGRGRRLRPSPVKQLADRAGLPVYQPESAAALTSEPELAKCDLLLVVAYGLLLPPAVLDLPRLGCVNLHLSLLPRWRGAAPVQRAILAGDTETGISLMQMDAGLDTGPVLAQRRCRIEPAETAGELQQRLARLGADCLLKSLPQLAAGSLQPTPQDDSQACYAPKITKDETWLDWRQPAEQLVRAVRAFSPAPVARATLADLECRIWHAEALPATSDSPPGTLVAAGKQGIDVATGNGVLRVQRLQVPGGRALTAAEFLNGRPDFLQAVTG